MSVQPEKIKVQCPGCERTLTMSPELRGRPVKCPQCGKAFRVGEKTPAPSPPRQVRTAASSGASGLAASPPERPPAPRPIPPPRSRSQPQSDDEESPAKPRKKKKSKRRASGAPSVGQGIMMAMIFGGVASVISAVGWAIVGAVTGMEIGWLAWGVGILCGIGVAKGLQDVHTLGGIVAAGWAVFGILLGKALLLYFVVLPNAATLIGADAAELRGMLSTQEFLRLLGGMFEAMDILFIILAIVSAYRLASGASGDD